MFKNCWGLEYMKYKNLLILGLVLVLASIVFAETFYEDVNVYGNLNVYDVSNNTLFEVNETAINLNRDVFVGSSWNGHDLNIGDYGNINVGYNGDVILNNYTGDLSAKANIRSLCSWSVIHNLDETVICDNEKFQAGMQLLRGGNRTVQYKIYCCEL